MSAIIELKKQDIRKETDSLGEVDVPSDKLWGAQTQRSLEHFSIGHDLIPREMIAAYAILKKAAANANHAGGRLDDKRHKLIVQTCDEILTGQHHDMFPLHVWMTGSGTQACRCNPARHGTVFSPFLPLNTGEALHPQSAG